jgi:hypothetical protein
MVSSGGRKQLELVKPILPDALLGNIGCLNTHEQSKRQETAVWKQPLEFIRNEGAGDPNVFCRLVQCRPFLTVSIDESLFCDL